MAATEFPPVSRAWTPSAWGCLLTLPGAGHTRISLQQLLAGEKRKGISTHLLGEEKLFIFPGKRELPAQLHSEAPADSAQQPQYRESLAAARQSRAQDTHLDLTRRNIETLPLAAK